MPRCTAWCLPVDEVLQHHGVKDVSAGLSSSEVDARRAEFGFNELQKEPGTPLWKMILEQFNDTLVKVGTVKPAVSVPLPETAAGGGHCSCQLTAWSTGLPQLGAGSTVGAFISSLHGCKPQPTARSQCCAVWAWRR